MDDCGKWDRTDLRSIAVIGEGADKVKDHSWHGSEIQWSCCGSVEFNVGPHARDLESGGGDEDVMHAGRLKDTWEA